MMLVTISTKVCFQRMEKIGINPVGYEIAVLVYPEGIDIMDYIDLLSEKYPEFINNILSLKKEKRGKFKRECMLLPF